MILAKKIAGIAISDPVLRTSSGLSFLNIKAIMKNETNILNGLFPMFSIK